MQAPYLSQKQELEVVQWIDKFIFNKVTYNNLKRDFADGVLVAEIIYNLYPSLVDLHNYQIANSASAKYNNWNTLNNKVFKKHLQFDLSKTNIEQIILGSEKVILRVIWLIKLKLKQHKERIQQKKKVLRQEISEQKIDLTLSDKDFEIKELRESIQILDMKLKKMNQLNKLKDTHIQLLTDKLNKHENM